MKRHKNSWLALLVAGVTGFIAGCGPLGQVNQGQVVEYDRTSGLITLIQDSNYLDPANPRFDVLPPLTIAVPGNPKEMGPAPEAGKLLHLDPRQHIAVVFDARAQSFLTIPYVPVSQQDGVQRDDPRVAKMKFPVIDRDRRTITTYCARERILITFTVADQHLAMPEETWRAGDQVRYYYKDSKKALRLMNVSKTDINKSGK